MIESDAALPKEKTRRGMQLYPENPFVSEIETRSRRVTNKHGNMMMVTGDGEIKAEIAGFWEAEEVDSTKFVKLFISGVKALKELTNAGTKVFEVLYLKMQEAVGKDRVIMAFSEVDQTLTPMSEATYGRGMRELVEKGFIAASPTQGIFWINLTYVWNGDRLAFVKEYRRAKTLPRPAKVDPRQLDLEDFT